MRLKKGDTVMVRSGKYKGQTGKILQTHPKLNKVTVEGINIVKRHKKPTSAHPQGGIVEITKPIWLAKVGILDGTKNRPSRLGYKLNKDGSKTRILKTSGKEIK
ncbi:MAG: 50S ribosomal protein L24 [Candidatus Saccharimonadales bacterium]